MNAFAARRRHPAALVLLLLAALAACGGLYLALAPKPAQAQVASSTEEVAKGKNLFLTNCATCHGVNATGTPEGPSLVGVGAAAVDFQVGTGRMPLAAPGVQAPRSKVQFDAEKTAALAAYVATLGPGPAVPDEREATAVGGNVARGGEIFRVNCAMCHNFAGSGGALTRGKYAPALRDVSPKHIWEAMVTGPQSMPVFTDENLSPQSKRDVIAYLDLVGENENPGGNNLGNLGPVGDGYFLWIMGVPLMLAAAVWLGRKAA